MIPLDEIKRITELMRVLWREFYGRLFIEISCAQCTQDEKYFGCPCYLRMCSKLALTASTREKPRVIPRSAALPVEL